MREEKFFCPECDYVTFENTGCPECGVDLKKIKGDDYAHYSAEQEDDTVSPVVDLSDDFDPTDVSWYSDEESYA